MWHDLDTDIAHLFADTRLDRRELRTGPWLILTGNFRTQLQLDAHAATAANRCASSALPTYTIRGRDSVTRAAGLHPKQPGVRL